MVFPPTPWGITWPRPLTATPAEVVKADLARARPRAGPSRNLSPPQRSRASRYRRAKACGRLSRSGILARRRARCGGGRRPSRTGRPTRDPPPHPEDRRPRRRNRGRVALLENQVRACDGPAARARRRASCVSSQWSSGCQCGRKASCGGRGSYGHRMGEQCSKGSVAGSLTPTRWGEVTPWSGHPGPARGQLNAKSVTIHRVPGSPWCPLAVTRTPFATPTTGTVGPPTVDARRFSAGAGPDPRP